MFNLQNMKVNSWKERKNEEVINWEREWRQNRVLERRWEFDPFSDSFLQHRYVHLKQEAIEISRMPPKPPSSCWNGIFWIPMKPLNFEPLRKSKALKCYRTYLHSLSFLVSWDCPCKKSFFAFLTIFHVKKSWKPVKLSYIGTRLRCQTLRTSLLHFCMS